MKRIYTVFLFSLTAAFPSAFSQDGAAEISIPPRIGLGMVPQYYKPTIRFGGTFFMDAFYDTYQSIDNRHGVFYFYPQAPKYDPEGKDLNKNGQFGMSVYQTRLNVRAADIRIGRVHGEAFVEADFMGSSSDYLQMFRLRHAYVRLERGRNELLIGQTNNVEYVEEIVSGSLGFGAGTPIAILSRPLMIRYRHRIGERFRVYGAIVYNPVAVGNSLESVTFDAGRNSGLPGFDARIDYDNDNNLFFGIGGGFRHIRPRLATDRGYKAAATASSANVTAFFRLLIGGHTLKAQGVYGSNLSHLNLTGGYGKRLSDAREGDYGYTNLLTYSVWGDYESARFARFFRAGFFGGYMKNLGSVKEIDRYVVFARNADLHCTGRISPRITWQWNSLVFGFEYSYYWARWGEEFDEKFRTTTCYRTTDNHRLNLVTRYSF